MNCNETEHWVGAYCDGELDLPRTLEIEQHLEDCPACAERREQTTMASRQIRAAAFRAPDNFQRRMRTVLGPLLEPRPLATTPQSPGGDGGLSPWFLRTLTAAAASVALAFILAQTVFQPSSDRAVLNEIVDSHVRSLIGNHQVDVASSDQHTVRPWFEGKVDFAPPVPDLSSRSFQIIGGRLDYIDGHPAATLVYGCRKHYISLFVWRSEPANTPKRVDRFETEPAQRGYHILKWKSAGLTYCAISEISAEQLRDFAIAFSTDPNP